VLYIAPFRSAILHQMLVLWSKPSSMIVFAECAVSCKVVSVSNLHLRKREARRTITGRSSAFPDARPKEATLPCPLAKHSAAVRRQGGNGAFKGALSVSASGEPPAVMSVIASCDKKRGLSLGHASFIYTRCMIDTRCMGLGPRAPGCRALSRCTQTRTLKTKHFLGSFGNCT
jgi:hypothetical protein